MLLKSRQNKRQASEAAKKRSREDAQSSMRSRSAWESATSRWSSNLKYTRRNNKFSPRNRTCVKHCHPQPAMKKKEVPVIKQKTLKRQWRNREWWRASGNANYAFRILVILMQRLEFQGECLVMLSLVLKRQAVLFGLVSNSGYVAWRNTS